MYRPISLPCVCGKVSERLPYTFLFNFLFENDLISQFQSNFKAGDSSINQLLSVIHDISVHGRRFSNSRCISWDIEKAFDNVWHK